MTTVVAFQGSGDIMRNLFAGALLALGLSAAPALAAPVVLTYTTDNNSGTLLGTPFTGQVVTLRATYESTAPISTTVVGSPGTCYAVTSATVTVGSGSAVAITDPTQVCQTNAGRYAGLYDSLPNLISHSEETYAGLDLSTVSGPFTISAGPGCGALGAHNSSTLLNVTGGTFQFSNTNCTNTSASNFAVALAAPPPPVPVPTMTEWAMVLFGTLLAGGAALYIQRRRLTEA